MTCASTNQMVGQALYASHCAYAYLSSCKPSLGICFLFISHLIGVSLRDEKTLKESSSFSRFLALSREVIFPLALSFVSREKKEKNEELVVI